MTKLARNAQAWLTAACLRPRSILLVLTLSLLSPVCAFGKGSGVEQLFPELRAEDRRLMSGYLQSLDFARCMAKPKETLQLRLAWNRAGHRCTVALLQKLNRPDASEKESVLIISLLGGTHDDLAAIALKKLLQQNVSDKTRWSAYAALAELGFYSRYHSGLLLKVVQGGHGGSDGNRKWDCAVLLATIHQSEAIWVQDQLYEQNLVDGALSELVGPLLEFRNLALHLPKRTER